MLNFTCFLKTVITDYTWTCVVQEEMLEDIRAHSLGKQPFLADRTNGRAYTTVLCPSVVCL